MWDCFATIQSQIFISGDQNLLDKALHNQAVVLILTLGLFTIHLNANREVISKPSESMATVIL